MHSLRKLLPGAVALSGIVLFLSWLHQSTAASAGGGRSPMETRMPPPLMPIPENPITTLSIAREAALLNSPDHTASEDLATLDLLLSCYRRHHDGNPVGGNEEISATLRGHNPEHLAYLPQAGVFFDEKGRLIDRWGTPYFFHALAADHMDIHSSGPDRVLWTNDDIVHHPGD